MTEPAEATPELLTGPLTGYRVGVTAARKLDEQAALAALPAGSEHAVEMAVARLRTAIGTRLVQTVVKRDHRWAVPA